MLKNVDITIPMPWGPIVGQTFGEKKPIPVLCVHGRSDNLETFRHLISLLPSNHYYVCIDLPGHGKSSHAKQGYILDLLWYTMCVKRVIDYFKWTKLYYIGHSLGGHIGILLAAFYPELLLKLIVLDGILYDHSPSPNTASALRDLIFDLTFKLENRSRSNQAPIYSLVEFVEKMKSTRNTQVSDEQIRAMAERNLTKVGPDQYKYSNDQRTKILGPINFTYEQLEGITSEICCPTMLILGKNSAATRPHYTVNRSPLKKNSNITFHIIDGDHDVHLAHPKEVATLIVPFLSEKFVSKL